jgi:hypothetical protein
MYFADDAVEALGCIMRAVSEGTISPSEGAEAATLVNSYTKSIDMADVVKRLDSLEAQIGARGCDVRMFGCLPLDGPRREGGLFAGLRTYLPWRGILRRRRCRRAGEDGRTRASRPRYAFQRPL